RTAAVAHATHARARTALVSGPGPSPCPVRPGSVAEAVRVDADLLDLSVFTGTADVLAVDTDGDRAGIAGPDAQLLLAGVLPRLAFVQETGEEVLALVLRVLVRAPVRVVLVRAGDLDPNAFTGGHPDGELGGFLLIGSSEERRVGTEGRAGGGARDRGSVVRHASG